MSMKAVILLLAVVLVIGGAAGGTLAWLVAKTDPIENAFSAANINIDLTETANEDNNNDGTPDIWVGKMVPGTDIEKDPEVIVEADSEACWLFVKVNKAGGDVTVGTTEYGFDDFVTYTIADGWIQLDGVADVYYREISADTAKTGDSYAVLANNKVSIPGTVTKAMLDGVNANNAPSLTFTAYAVQKVGFENAALAWEEAKNLP